MKNKIFAVLLVGAYSLNYSFSLSDIESYAQNAEDCTRFAVLLPYIWQLNQQEGNITQNDSYVLAYLKNIATQLKCPMSTDIIKAMSFVEGLEKVEEKVIAVEAKVVSGVSAFEADLKNLAGSQPVQKLQQESVGIWAYIKSWLV